MLDKPPKRPRGRPRKEPSTKGTLSHWTTLKAARNARLESDRFNALCGLSLAWQEEHRAEAVTTIK